MEATLTARGKTSAGSATQNNSDAAWKSFADNLGDLLRLGARPHFHDLMSFAVCSTLFVWMIIFSGVIL